MASLPSFDTWFCQACVSALPAIKEEQCSICGEPFDGQFSQSMLCPNCNGKSFAFDFATSHYRAEDAVRTLIHRFKYEKRYELRGALGLLLAESLNDARLQVENLSDWLLVPVPLHPVRQFSREFNQSWELCLQLAKRTGIRAIDPLRRSQLNLRQAKLGRQQRLNNVKGTIRLSKRWPWRVRLGAPDLRGRSILLVDDVLTTGSTANECARILRRDAGVQKVVVITVARG